MWQAFRFAGRDKEVYATRDIAAGDELLQDYRDIAPTPWLEQTLADAGLATARQFAEAHSGSADRGAGAGAAETGTAGCTQARAVGQGQGAVEADLHIVLRVVVADEAHLPVLMGHLGNDCGLGLE